MEGLHISKLAFDVRSKIKSGLFVQVLSTVWRWGRLELVEKTRLRHKGYFLVFFMLGLYSKKLQSMNQMS